MKDLISIRDLTREDIDKLIGMAIKMKREIAPIPQKEERKIASIFFENSTRTRISSETAATNLGYQINGFSGAEGTSVSKGEPIIDTAKMLEAYGYEMIIMRHGLEGSAQYVSENVSIPVINGGDGSNSHPTQTLLDLMTIAETQDGIDNKKIALVGDLKYGRTVHSLLLALAEYKCDVYLVSPPELQMPSWRIEDYKKSSGRDVIISHSFDEIINDVDVLYMTRIQRERFPQDLEGELEFKKVSGHFHLTANKLNQVRNNLAILHPLPRDKNNIEISLDVDATPYAQYIEQAKNGLFMRQAIITALARKMLIGRPKVAEVHPADLVELEITDGQKIGSKLVYRLDNGTLIDHIEQGKGMAVYNALNLGEVIGAEVVLSMNINSEKRKKKDVIAIHERTLAADELYKVALISSDHTINFINDKRVTKKGRVVLPSVIDDLLDCPNPKCISREEHKEFAKSRFYLEGHRPLKVRCHYCERILKRSELEVRN